MNRSRITLPALVVAAAMALPLALSVPAQASTTSNGCTVTPRTPYHNGDFTAGGAKRIAYEVDVTCAAGLVVTIYQERWEQDPNQSDDFIGSSTLVSDFTAGAGSVTRTVTGTLPDTDDFTDNYEEMYQRVRFKVTSGVVTSPLTAWEYSAVRSIRV